MNLFSSMEMKMSGIVDANTYKSTSGSSGNMGPLGVGMTLGDNSLGVPGF
jgi:hypothetical protein